GFLGLAGPMTIFALIAGVILIAVAVVIPRDQPPVLRQAAARSDAATRPASKGSEAGKRDGVWRDRNVGPYLIYGVLSCCVQAINVYTLGFVVLDTMALP